MKVTNINKDGNILTFDISDITVTMLNAFRRTVIAYVPAMAIEDVNYTTNTSILHDENLAHRLGLVPLTTDLETYESQENCSCEGEGCGRCTCTLGIDITGPATVYSGDLISQDERVKPVFDTMPLVKLMPKHHLKFEAKARLGTGVEHVKWQSGLCSYELKDDGSYHVLVESFGQHPVDVLVTKAFEVVEDKIGQLEKAVK